MIADSSPTQSRRSLVAISGYELLLDVKLGLLF